MLSAFFTGKKVTDYTTACLSNTGYFSLYFKAMLENGIYIAPSQFEAAFVSTAHSENDIEQTLESAGNSLRALIAV
jgi:glutamate-1-semialdehyde 2,1-aminomutase